MREKLKARRALVAVLIVIAIVAFGVVWWLREAELEKPAFARGKPYLLSEVRMGWRVKFDYIARYQHNGKVFETTLREIGENASIPKAVFFDPERPWRFASEEEPYAPCELIVGEGEMPGLEERLIGMKVGEKKNITIAPGVLWKLPDETLIRHISLRETLALYEHISLEAFEANYTFEEPREGLVVNHTFWNWTVVIEEVGEGSLVWRHAPPLGLTVRAFPWNSTVVEISMAQRTLVVEHKPTADLLETEISVDLLTKYNSSLPPLPKDAIITAIEPDIVLDFNEEPCGKTLVYEVTIVSISKP